MVANQLSKTTAHIQCSKCHASNRVGTLLCESCGTPLISGQMPNIATQVMNPSSLPEFESALAVGRGSEFRQGMSLQLASIDGLAALTLTPSYGRSIVMGRSDPIQAHEPEVDLTEIGGYAKGISRSHASLVFINSRLQLMDMNSSNGTYINEEKIAPRKPVELRDGDRVRLGKLEMQVNFPAQ